MIYEPLFFYDTAKAGDIKPWLGTSYAWSDGGKTLTVQLRHNVKWTDGKPFTSADVVFTFDQALHSTALNKFGLPLASVSADRPVRRDDQLHQVRATPTPTTRSAGWRSCRSTSGSRSRTRPRS